MLKTLLFYYWNQFLDFFELLTNERFWLSLMGERTLNILKRYGSNDTIIFYLFMTFIPAIYELVKWMYKNFSSIIEKLFYVSIIIEENELIYTPVDEYLTKNYQQVHTLRRVRGKTGYDDPQAEQQNSRRNYYYRRNDSSQEVTPIIDLVPEKHHEFQLVYKGYTIYVKRSDEEPSGDLGRNPFLAKAQFRTDTIIIRMRTRDLARLQTFIQDWVTEYYEARKNKLIIYKCDFERHYWDEESQWKEHGFRKIRPFNSVILKKNAKERILNDILTFKESKEWYYERGIPYRRGYLLYGPPGTGKTSFIQSLASHIHMNVAILNLSAITNDDALCSSLSNLPKNSILVLEDVDHYRFDEGVSDKKNEEKSKSKSNSVSVSGILNAIDGIASLEELIIFMTCNDMNTIPPALIRPGRVDLKLHLGYIDDYQAEFIFWKFFCNQERDANELEDIDRDKYPFLKEVVVRLIEDIKVEAQRVSRLKDLDIQVSPAELLSYLLFHALEHKLSTCPNNLDNCLKSVLSHVSDFIDSIAKDRIQAIEHEKKKNQEELKKKNKKKKKKDSKVPTPPSTTSSTSSSDDSDSD